MGRNVKGRSGTLCQRQGRRKKATYPAIPAGWDLRYVLRFSHITCRKTTRAVCSVSAAIFARLAKSTTSKLVTQSGRPVLVTTAAVGPQAPNQKWVCEQARATAPLVRAWPTCKSHASSTGPCGWGIFMCDVLARRFCVDVPFGSGAQAPCQLGAEVGGAS